jgi:prepilin-type N-terminal cleavage/methylation domain-containing protein
MKQGFSLVELSIVLVILGLLTGGILSGQSLIRAAELRSVATEYQQHTTAVQSFRDKYMSLPGDMNNATAFWGKDNAACPTHTGTTATNGVCNGNSNGLLDVTGVANGHTESFQSWKHLALAGLIEGTYSGLAGSAGSIHAIINSNVPKSKLTNAGWSSRYLGQSAGGTGAYAGDYGNLFSYGANTTNSSTRDPVMRPEEAWNVDSKVDDGIPSRGKLITHGVIDNGCSKADSGAATPDNLNASYNLQRSEILCALYFIRQF